MSTKLAEEPEYWILPMDARWDHGFITSEDEYVQQRIRLQMELEQLTPVTDNELEQAADLLANFEKHWERLAGNDEAQHDLVKLIVDRVYVQDKSVVAMTLHSNYHLVLNHKANGPTEFSVDPLVFTHGSDGIRSLTRIGLTITFMPRYLHPNYQSYCYSYSGILSQRPPRFQASIAT